MNQPAQQSFSPDAVRLFHEAAEWEKQGDNMQAWHLLTACLNEDPTIVGAWHNLGVVLGKLKHYNASASAFYKALALAPTVTQVMANYAWTLHLSGRSEQALPLVKRILDLEPDKPQHWTNLSQIQLSLDQYDEALQSGLKAVETGPNDVQARLAWSLALLRLGDYENGLREYESRFPYVLPHVMKYPYPVWRGEDISKQRLFIPAEQGIGDAVQFLRFIPEAAKRCKQIICYVHDNTVSLYKRNLPHNVEIHPLPRELPAADVFCPLLSLPVALKKTNEEIKSSWYKYKYNQLSVHKKDFPDNVLKIGICWAGDPKHDNDLYRSTNLREFFPLTEMPNTQVYSFQIGPRSVDMDNQAAHGIIKNLAPQIRDTNASCALLAECMDVAVTVDTAFAHMAGAMGVKTYLMIGKQGVDWRWLTGEGITPWYPSVKLMRQMRSGDWAEVIQRVKQDITDNR